MAGIGRCAESTDEGGPFFFAVLDILGNDLFPVSCHASADSHPEREVPDPSRDFRREACKGVQAQVSRGGFDQIVEEELAVEVIHHPLADLLDDLLGRVAREKEPG